MLRTRSQRRLRASGERLTPFIERQHRVARETASELVVLGLIAGRIEELEGYRCAKRKLVVVDEGGPAFGDLNAAVPGARIGEVRVHLGRAEPTKLLRAWTDPTPLANVIPEASPRLEPDYLVEGCVHR